MLAKTHWWKWILAVLVVGAAGVLLMGLQTYQEAPPIPDFVDADGRVVLSSETILSGQSVFAKYALMEYGTMFGDGGARGPDFTAEGLHVICDSMVRHYAAALPAGQDEVASAEALDGIRARVRREIKANTFDPEHGTVRLTEGQAKAWEELAGHTFRKFTQPGKESFKPAGYITDPEELRNLAGFFYWGAWVCGATRPGSEVSYTHNWPFDPEAGNTLTSASVVWSVIGSLALILALGLVLYAYGRMPGNGTWQAAADMDRPATADTVAGFAPSPTQRATYKFFAVAAVLFLLQVLSGVLTIHDFVGFTVFFGHDLAKDLPLPVTRSWHVQLSVLWIATCWIAGSIFLLPKIAGREPAGQLRLVNLLFGMLAAVVAGTILGGFLGPMGLLGDYWRALGNQGWEFVELGKVWQGVLFAALILWGVIVVRGVRPALRPLQPFSLPHWMLYSVVAISVLFLSSFVATPRTNFVIADFWRWMVIHMWAECFFEVFTTVVIAWCMVLMGLVGREAASRVVYFATLLFLGSGFLGISHNFYWNAKPEAMLAVGSVFSTMQVVPLILLTLAAWKFRQMPGAALRQQEGMNGRPAFGHSESYLFLVAVNFWNFLGAGVLGFIINLPVVNYFEHGTYLTVNHGHAALMGVYGNLSLAAILFCCRYLIRAERWNSGLIRMAFWSLNVGLMLMVVMDLFPAGILQFKEVLDHGLWRARSQEFVLGAPFQTLTHLRVVGGALFLLGGVIPVTWFMVDRWKDLKPAQAAREAVPAPPENEPALADVRTV